MRITLSSLSLIVLFVGSLFMLQLQPVQAAAPADNPAKTTGIVFKLQNNCGTKVGVEVNGKAFQVPDGAAHRFDYPAGTKIYKLDNGVRGALLYTLSNDHSGAVLPICK